MKYIYGIDLAQSLNYTAIIVTSIDKNKARIAAIRKYKDLTYPQVQEILFNDLFKRCVPDCIVVDYTNERSFAETMESKFNSSFMDSSSSGYRNWRMVQPVTFNQAVKLEMKQNAREIFEKKQFSWPSKLLTDPRVWSLIDELKQQMLREYASPGMNGQFSFPKPEGHDNDLIIALELNLYGAKRFLYRDDGPGFVPRGSYNPMEEYICLRCKNEDHEGTIHTIYYDPTGGQITCPCKPCNGLA